MHDTAKHVPLAIVSGSTTKRKQETNMGGITFTPTGGNNPWNDPQDTYTVSWNSDTALTAASLLDIPSLSHECGGMSTADLRVACRTYLESWGGYAFDETPRWVRQIDRLHTLCMMAIRQRQPEIHWG